MQERPSCAPACRILPHPPGNLLPYPRVNRLVLRFGNQQADTVKEHRAILEGSDHVWWGWWAKAWERSPTQREWEAIRAALAGGSTVGLLDRRNLRYYEATADDVHLLDGKAKVSTPALNTTPGYYRDDPFRAWFRFTSISDITLSRFKEHFRFVPLSDDQTLFWYDPKHPPQDNWLDEETTHSSTILHISDLHFGPDFPYGTTDSSDARPVARGTRRLQDIISGYLREADLPVGTVVVSGDLIDKGRQSYFKEFESFLDDLLDQLGLERHHAIVVPGNHDLWLTDDLLSRYSKDFAHELAYREWYDGYFATSGANLKLERLRVFECNDRINLAFLQVNSARLRDTDTKDYGYVGSHRYEPHLKTLGELNLDNLVRFFVMHHHIMPVPGTEHLWPGRPISVTVDAGEIVERLQHAHVDCVLHGHQHLPLVGSIGRMSLSDQREVDGHLKPLAVVGCGSTGASYQRLPDNLRQNTFNLYSFAADESQTLMHARIFACSQDGTVHKRAEADVPFHARPRTSP